jgi:hypothetical protein
MLINLEKFSNEKRKIIACWLGVSIISLAVSGVFAVLLVIARTPVVQDIFHLSGMFHHALTVHVNLSVLVWFLSGSCVIWQIFSEGRNYIIDNILLYVAVIGVLLIIISPFIGASEALINNYVPIITNNYFIAGIFVFLSAIFLQSIIIFSRLLVVKLDYLSGYDKLMGITSLSSSVIYIVSFIGLVVAYLQLESVESDIYLEDYYEYLFWGGGHIMQILYTQIMLISWVWLATISGFIPKKIAVYYGAFCFNILVCIANIGVFAFYPADDIENRILFTNLMKYFLGISPIMIGGMIVSWLLKNWNYAKMSPLRWYLIWSIILFALGGAIAWRIDGINTVIPAHYHGSIVGVTLALMGIVCYILSTYSCLSHDRNQVLTLQPAIYGVGQIMHILGLAWSGGYGALRKTPGAMESVEGKAAMGLMGLGGLLSVLGGVLFVYICVHGFATRVKK